MTSILTLIYGIECILYFEKMNYIDTEYYFPKCVCNILEKKLLIYSPSVSDSKETFTTNSYRV